MLAPTAAAPRAAACQLHQQFGRISSSSASVAPSHTHRLLPRHAAPASAPPPRRRQRGAVTPQAVSIFSKVRGEDDASLERSPPPPPPPPTAAPKPTPVPLPLPLPMPMIAPSVISSKAYMLSTAEDLGAGVSCDEEEDEECRLQRLKLQKEKDGIVQWTLKYVDKGLDDIEREKPKQAEVAWRVATEAEIFARSPAVQKGMKLSADVGMEVVKAAAPIVGNIGKFAAKTVFSAAVSGLMKNGEKKKTVEKKSGDKKK